MRWPPSLRYNAVMICTVFAFFISLALGTTAFAADPIFPPGSRVGLVPPPGMSVGASYQGFEDREHRVAMLVSQVSAQTYERISQEFTPETIRQMGMEEVARDTLHLAF